MAGRLMGSTLAMIKWQRDARASALPGRIEALLAECEAALRPIAEREGLQLMRFPAAVRTDPQLILPVALALVEDPETAKDRAVPRHAHDFISLAGAHGFKQGDLGRKFRLRGHEYRIVDWRRKARKKRVLCERLDTDGDTRYTFVADVVLALLEAQDALKEVDGC